LSKIPVNVTYEVTKTVRTEIYIDANEFHEWVGTDEKPTDDLVKEFLESGDDYTLKSLLGEDLGYNVYVALDNVEVCTHVI
jgi:hypothetical protein